MRIITGKFKRKELASVPGNTARPTTDFMREVIFSVLTSCSEEKVLDIFAGSGSLGFEALSRGAAFVDFVDFSVKSISTIIKNAERLNCTDQCKIHRRKVGVFLQSCETKYDLIFMDPPYNHDLVNKTIAAVFGKELLSPQGRLVVEHSAQEPIAAEWQEQIEYQREGKNTQITILKNQESNEMEKDIK
ncbi:MAG TPA: 16S rRNA (guanine(966)-N(2))-methyltransferase RsmD [Candidatus Cloacimonadota bacterium]|nr:16S rRNA (guanine(966)-N(2))-methyltransferase RsmD [Candidatus Cloacimonadota bacterium]